MKELTLAPSDSSSSSSTDKWTYDVFLNFRGQDTRNGFTGHLYNALRGAGIHTFIDDRLERGEEIAPALLEAIDKSRIAIVILSENYASSTFCLEELVKIFECTKQKSRLILPIFYKVDPSDVRHLRGSYQEALVRHEKRFKNNEEKIQSWKSALREVADLSGWHFEERYGYEYEFIKKIVQEVSKRINRTSLHVAKYPVGLKPQEEEVISLLDLGSNQEIIMVGIHGIGGIGKTTIACAVYNVIMDQFESACFLSDVRERSEKHGLVELQETLLSELTAEKGIKVENVRKGIQIIKTRLCQKKVLLILDDVDSKKQLEAIIERVDWFGFGSRIIMTTRDKHLLAVHGVSRNFEVKELCFEEALELFSWNAFKKNEVDSRYASISTCVTNYCSGLPLALEIIGSNLFGKTQEEWKSALDIYKNIPDKNIGSVLEVSYNGLEEIEQEIFLDIACFFNGYNLEYVKSILLNGHGYDPKYGIGVLMEKSLIKIEQWKEVKIHDLMAQMGKEIVRRQSPSNPENCSRLWSDKDILSILEEDKGSNKIEFLKLNLSQSKEVLWNGEAFKKMNNLKILIIENASFSCEPKYLPNSLRVLEWKNYSWSSLPSDFHPRSLVTLNLCESLLTVIKPLKKLESLTEMNLSFSPFLKQVGDISEAVNLRNLNIADCKNLIEVHHSVGFLDKLAKLNATGCTKLSKFPCSFKSESFESLRLTGCVSLQSIPKIHHLIPDIRVDSLYYSPRVLELSKRGGHLMIECGIAMLPKLDDQENVGSVMRYNLSVRDPWYRNMINIHLSVWRPYYCNLTKLILESCNLTDDFLYQRLPWFPNLVDLFLRYNRFTVLPECMNECYHLKKLELDGCKGLREMKGIPPNIEFLSTADCISLTPQSPKILLSQAFHEDRRREVIVPGFKIPKWMDHSCRGSSISFWFRNELLRLVLCFVSNIYADRAQIRVFINGIKLELTLLSQHRWICSETPCISMGDLHGWDEKFKKELKKDEWNHVLISLDGGDVNGMGVHVYKEEKGPNNVRFIDSKGPDNVRFIDSQRCIINHDRSLISDFSLQNKFCLFLDMRVCDSIYSHKETERLYHMLNSHKFSAQYSKVNKSAAVKAIRIMLAPTKVKVLALKILNEYFPVQSLQLPTGWYLFKKKFVKSPMCPICETKFETTEHVFFECSWTRPLWLGCDLDWTIKDRWPSNGGTSWLEQKFQEITKVHPNGKSVTGLMGNIMWAIWKARNEFVLQDKPVNPLEALRTAKAMHVKYFSDYYLEALMKAKELMAAKACIGTTHPAMHVECRSQLYSEALLKAKELMAAKASIGATHPGTQVKNKAKRKREEESKDNIEGEPNCHKVVQPFANITQEPIMEIVPSQENESLDKENLVNKSTLNDFDIGYGNDDPVSKLALLLSMDEEVSASQLTQARNKDKSIEMEDKRGSTIKKAMLTLSECFQIDLSTIHSTLDTKAKLEQAIQFLQSVTAKDDITTGFKSFVDNLAQYLPTFWE